MKVKEYIAMCDRVKLGAGTEFLYCGVADPERIDNESRYIFRATKRKCDKSKAWLEKYDDWSEDAVERMMARFRSARRKAERDGTISEKPELMVTDIVKRGEFERKCEARKKIVTNSYKTNKKRIDDWVPFLEREIVETYPSLVDDRVMIVIMEGDTPGEFWDEEEYNKARRARHEGV